METTRSRRRLSLVMVALLGLLSVACGDPVAGSLLSDPREILANGIAVTGAIRTVHVRLDAASRTLGNGGPPGAPDTATIEGDLDFAAVELSAIATTPDEPRGVGLILADGSLFVQSSMNGRWQQLPNIGAGGAGGLFGMIAPGVQPAPDLRGLLLRAAADPALDVALAGVEDCASGQCYRLRATIPPELLWNVAIDAMGLRNNPLAANIGQMPADFPQVAAELVFDTSSLLLTEVRLAVSERANELSGTMRLSAHDRQVVINPPPPGLTDQFQIGP